MRPFFLPPFQGNDFPFSPSKLVDNSLSWFAVSTTKRYSEIRCVGDFSIGSVGALSLVRLVRLRALLV